MPDTNDADAMRLTERQSKELAEREKIRKVQALLEKHPQTLESEDLPVQHVIGDGCYVRTMYIPAGVMVLGKRHRVEHQCLLTQGNMLVSLNGSEAKQYLAPYCCTYQGGAQRILYAIEPSIWMNVHPIPAGLRDLQEIEDYLIEQ